MQSHLEQSSRADHFGIRPEAEPLTDAIINVEHLNKVYALFDSPMHRLREALHPFGKKFHKDFYALRDVSVKLKRGDSLGILGHNGAGKSTLLGIIYGVIAPTSGTVEVNGRVGYLNIGGNFNPEYTGRENVKLMASIFGIPAEGMKDKVAEIIDFAEIGDFIDQPVKYYSSGMYSRLAFSTNFFMDPEILIVDEGLAAGDIRFVAKCRKRIDEFVKRQHCFIFVSHDITAITKYCNTAIMLEAGEVVEAGNPDRVCRIFHNRMMGVPKGDVGGMGSTESERARDGIVEIADIKEYDGTRGALISGVAVKDEHGRPAKVLTSGRSMTIEVEVAVTELQGEPYLFVYIVDYLGNILVNVGNFHYDVSLSAFEPGEKRIVKFSFYLPPTRNGKYALNLLLQNKVLDHMEVLHSVFGVYPIEISEPGKLSEHSGLLRVEEVQISVE